MTNLVMLVGLAGSGKSTWAKENAGEYNATILSSDQYRKILFGSEEILGDNDKLFSQIYADAIELLKNGTSVILDSTYLTYKKRRAFLEKINSLDVNKICILFGTSFDICLERNANRERHVPEHVIKKMRESFNVPMYSEGWNEIKIVWEYNQDNYKIEDYLKIADVFDQDNPHHSMTLGRHSRYVHDYVGDSRVDKSIELAGLLHDVGKIYTKAYKNSKGEDSEMAHYFGHGEVGSYESLFYLNEDSLMLKEKEILFSSALICYHMRPYFCSTEKAKKKLLDTVGEDLYYFLDILHNADVLAH